MDLGTDAPFAPVQTASYHLEEAERLLSRAGTLLAGGRLSASAASTQLATAHITVAELLARSVDVAEH